MAPAVKIEKRLDPRDFGLHKAAYSVKEFCSTVSISRPFFYDGVKAGKIKTKKYGSKTLILAADAAAFLASLQDAA